MSLQPSLLPSPPEFCRTARGAFLTGVPGALALWAGFANDAVSLPPLVLLYPLCLALLGVSAASRGAALRRGWLCAWAGHAAALYWLALPVHNVGGLPWPLAVPCALFVSACLAAAGGLFSLAAFHLRQRTALMFITGLAATWYSLEWLFAVVAGFPWLPLAGALTAWHILTQAADSVGACMVGALWTAAALALCWPGKAARRRGAGLLLIALLLGYGAWRLRETPADAAPSGPDTFSVLFVEGNIDQNIKWTPAFQRRTTEIYLTLTQAGLAERPAEKPLIIWPETALPYDLPRFPLYNDTVRMLAASAQSPLLTGLPGFEGSGPTQRVYNRALLIGPDGTPQGSYDKVHLVPFGEYVPSWLDWDFLAALLQEVGTYTPGKSAEPLRNGRLALGMLICYEGVFPWLAQERVAKGANILVDISNDGWFGATPAPRQHLYLTALRAIEQRRWILRGTNTGISAVIDHRGRPVVSGGQFRQQWLWGRARLMDGVSLYHRLAPLIPPFGLLLCMAVLFAPAMRSTSNTTRPQHAATE